MDVASTLGYIFGRRDSELTELSKAFELAEVSKPGILDDLVREICTTIQALSLHAGAVTPFCRAHGTHARATRGAGL